MSAAKFATSRAGRPYRIAAIVYVVVAVAQAIEVVALAVADRQGVLRGAIGQVVLSALIVCLAVLIERSRRWAVVTGTVLAVLLLVGSAIEALAVRKPVATVASVVFCAMYVVIIVALRSGPSGRRVRGA
jgi:uncharacterized membrane protein (UPF0136 family)